MFKRVIIALLCIGLSAAGPAILPASPPNRDPIFGVLLPPVHFDYEPELDVVEIGADYHNIDVMCRAVGANHQNRIEGCSYLFDKQTCVIITPRGVPASFIIAVRRHEKGHCNGWVHQ